MIVWIKCSTEMKQTMSNKENVDKREKENEDEKDEEIGEKVSE